MKPQLCLILITMIFVVGCQSNDVATISSQKPKINQVQEVTIKETGQKTDPSQVSQALTLPEPNHPAQLKQQDFKPPAEALRRTVEGLPDNKRLLFSLYDFATGETLSHKGDQVVFPASLIKTLYLHIFLEEVQQGRQSLDAVYALRPQDKFAGETIVGGMGRLQHKPAGTEVTYRKLLWLMVAESDNVATNIITRELGFEHITERIKKYGLEKTRANRKMYDTNSERPDNLTTMNDLTTLLALLEERQFLEEEFYEKAFDIKFDSHKARIGRYAPGDVIVVNKLGNVATLISDMAIIHFPHREPIALAVMVQRIDGKRLDAEYGEEVIGDLAKLILEHYVNS